MKTEHHLQDMADPITRNNARTNGLAIPTAGRYSWLAQKKSSFRDRRKKAPGESLGPIGKCITVLLLEERTMVRQGINALLGFRGDIAVVGQAEDCGQAFALAEKLRPDVVIVAMRLAIRDGLASLRRAFQSCCGANLLVLMPHDNHPFLGHLSIKGAAAYLTEQASAQLLTTTVREIHEENNGRDQAARSAQNNGQPPPHGTAEEDDDSHRLTAREREVLQLIAEGNANKQTASKLSISIKTVEKHRQHVMDKLGIHETATLTRYALYAGIAR